VRAESDAHRDLSERDARDQGGAPLREVALVEVGVVAVELDRDGLAEDRVAEELEALVVRDPAVLVGEGAVRERELEQVG
jgi:hypothetical protein